MSQSKAEVRPQGPAIPDPASYAQCPFQLTLLDSPSLPVSLIRQAGDLLRERRAPSRRHNEPESRLPLLDQRPWYRELPAQIQALLATPKAAPAGFPSRAADLPDLWRDYLPNPYSWANSLLIHLLALTAMLLPFAFRQVTGPACVPKKLFDLTPLVLTLPQLHGHDEKTGGGGGGGVSSALPASRGALPPFARTQFTPPMVTIPNSAPVLPMAPTLLGPPELKLPAMKLDMPWGDPKGVVGPLSGGPGKNGGIGDGDGTGVGPSKGPGYGPGSDGGCCGGPFRVGIDGVSEPIAIYSPEPAYSEEARKAKFGGIVMLWIVVDAQGIVRNVQIAKHLGMGLDEEAVKTVSTWKFKPAMRQGVAVPVQVQVEVSFRLF
ncbi:MAG: energy transducer TonB [Terriglobia bacterium]